MEKWLLEDKPLMEMFSNIIIQYLEKDYVARCKDDRKIEIRLFKELYLPHHPLFYPIKPGKILRVLNWAAKFLGAFPNRSLLIVPGLLQNLIYVLLPFRQHPFPGSNYIKGFFLQVGVLTSDQ